MCAPNQELKKRDTNIFSQNGPAMCAPNQELNLKFLVLQTLLWLKMIDFMALNSGFNPDQLLANDD